MPTGEIVTIATGGGRWTAFKSVEIEAAVNDAARTFTIVVAFAAGPQGTNAIFTNFAPISISTKAVDDDSQGFGDLLLTGYIDRRQPKLRAAEMTVSGRTKGQDVVDCSHNHPTGRFENKTALQIAQAIDIYDVGFSSDLTLDPIPEFHLTPGETVFREVERLCRDESAVLFGQPDGSIKLWNASVALKRNGPIIEGVNIVDGEADHNCAGRHSHKHVRGHQAKGTGKAAHLIEAVARDGGVPRTRHHIRIHDGNTDKTRAAKRANHHRDRTAGNGLRATVEVDGWRDDAGSLWLPGNKFWTQSPRLDIGQDMLIERVRYSQTMGDGEGGGTKAHLTIVDPRAYAGQGGGRNKSSSEWGIDGQDAS